MFHDHTPHVSLGRRSLMLSLLASATLAACGGSGDPPDPRQQGKTVDEAAAAAVSSGGLVGAAMAHVGVDAESSAVAVAGVRRLGGSDKIASDDTFNIGSNTKAMSAMVIASLVDQGRLAWDTRIVEALPDVLPGLRSEFAGVTLEQLLNHRGGMLAFNGSADDEARFLAALAADTGAIPETLTGRRRYFATWLVQQAPPTGVVPGRDFFYSNAGYALAATMVEALTGQSFETHFDMQLVSALAIGGRWRMPSEVPATQPAGHEGPKGAVQIHVPSEEDLATEPWLRVIAPAGYWACSAADYARWLRWHLLALGGRATPLPTGYVQRLSALTASNYAMGWSCDAVEGRQLLSHTGHTAGFMCEAVVDQAGLQAAFGLTNTGHVADDLSSWVLSLLDRELAEVYRYYRT